MKRKVYFRADADRSIGYGHFIRSLALVSYLKDEFDCVVFAQTPDEFQISQAEGICPLVSLPDDESRFQLFLERLDGSEIVVPDNYFYSEDYFRRIASLGCKTVKVQDFFGQESCADAVVYPCRNPHWAMLRPPFLQRVTVKRNPGRVIVSFGGADPLGLTAKYVTKLEALGFETVTFNGMSAPCIAELMRSSGAIVCSASSVCYEALSCGCKVYAGYYVDNQLDFYSELQRRGLIVPLGDLRTLDSLPSMVAASEGQDEVRELFLSAPSAYRALFHSLEMEMVDYPSMTEEQSRAVWEVRTRPEICRWMTNPATFPFDSHLRFVEGLKRRKDIAYFAFFKDGRFVGSYDFTEIEGERASRGLFVNPDFQGMGIASMMEARMDGVALSMGLKELRADILNDNVRSLAYHHKSGYDYVSKDEVFTHFKKSL